MSGLLEEQVESGGRGDGGRRGRGDQSAKEENNGPEIVLGEIRSVHDAIRTVSFLNQFV